MEHREKKTLRSEFFRTDPRVRRCRRGMGNDAFDEYYRSVYRFLNTLYFEQYFVVGKICSKKPELKDMFLLCCDIYYHVDYDVNIHYNRETDTATILRPEHPLYRNRDHYWPLDMYTRIVRNPSGWGIDPDWLYLT